jgi:hypothetical protein
MSTRFERLAGVVKGDWVPNPNPRHADFEPGNVLALTHGAQSERAIEAKAAEVRSHLFTAAPWLATADGEPIAAYVPEIARFLRAEAREQLLHDHILTVTADKGAGAVPQRVWEGATAASNLASRLGDKLGLNPQALARLKLTSAGAIGAEATLSDLMAEGRTIRLAAEARHAAQAAQLPATPAEPERGES